MIHVSSTPRRGKRREREGERERESKREREGIKYTNRGSHESKRADGLVEHTLLSQHSRQYCQR